MQQKKKDLDSASTRDDISVLHSTLYDHDRIVKTALNLLNELLSAAAEDECASLRLRTLLEYVVSLAADLSLLKGSAGSKVFTTNISASRLDRSSNRFHHTLQIASGHSAGAEDVAISKPLRREIANGELAEDDLRTCLLYGLELAVNNLPLRIYNRLVI